MRLLVFSRLLYPSSKRNTFSLKENFFDNFKFSLNDIYSALTHFYEISEELQKHLHANITKNYGRNLDLVYYNVTNFYFEIDKQDDLRKKAFQKNTDRI